MLVRVKKRLKHVQNVHKHPLNVLMSRWLYGTLINSDEIIVWENFTPIIHESLFDQRHSFEMAPVRVLALVINSGYVCRRQIAPLWNARTLLPKVSKVHRYRSFPSFLFSVGRPAFLPCCCCCCFCCFVVDGMGRQKRLMDLFFCFRTKLMEMGYCRVWMTHFPTLDFPTLGHASLTAKWHQHSRKLFGSRSTWLTLETA